MITTELLDDLETKMGQATPAAWRAEGQGSDRYVVGFWGHALWDDRGIIDNPHDVDFIVTARNEMPHLLAAARESIVLRDRVRLLEELVSGLRAPHTKITAGTCDDLALYADGALNDEDAEAFRNHLAGGCPRCQEKLPQVLELLAAFDDAGERRE